MQVLADASLPNVDKLFQTPFELTLYKDSNDLNQNLNAADILVCRSTLSVNQDLLSGTRVKCVATASSGTDHIDKQYLHSRGIRLLDAKGTNARAVCDYVVATLAWVITQDICSGSRVAIVGAGKVGSMLGKRLQGLGFEVICYDPLLADVEPNFISCKLSELNDVDIICIHANLHASAKHPSRNMFNKTLLANLKPGVVIINAARGDIVNEQDLLAINNKITYCTDVFSSEPTINPKVVEFAEISTPHIAGHSIEAKKGAVFQIAANIYELYTKSGSQSFMRPQKNIESALVSKPNVGVSFLQDTSIWDAILQIYNPHQESMLLRVAQDKTKQFLSLRKSHTFRHDFTKYITADYPQHLKLAMI